MNDDQNGNGRTHEPSLRELNAEFDGFKELMVERDRRYEQSFRESKEAVIAALTAAKEQTTASFAASEKAIVKAESSQTQYNVGHNDLTKKMDAQYREMLPRHEADSRFHMVEDKIEDGKRELASLRESRSAVQGRETQHAVGVSYGQFIVVAILSAIGLLVAVVTVVIQLTKLH